MFALKKLSSSKWVSGEGHGARNYGQPLVMKSIQLTTARNQGPQSCKREKMNFALEEVLPTA